MNTEANKIRYFFKRWPRFYYFIGAVFGPLMPIGLSGRKFLSRYADNGLTLNIGSGSMNFGRRIVNIDIQYYKGVHVIADINELPYADASVKRIVCDTVFEHLRDPQAAVKEIHRVLSADSLAYITVPFLYPFHPSPGDYVRWTKAGVFVLLKDFEIIESGIRAGPFSTLNVYLCYLFALIFSFGNKTVYGLLVNLSMFIFFPIKFLDLIFGRMAFADDMAEIFYFVIKRK